MNEIYRLVGDDSETKATIDKHLLLIASLIDPQCGAKDKLKDIVAVTKPKPDIDGLPQFNNGTPEGDFLINIIGKVEKIVASQDVEQMTAQDAFKNVMNSGLVNEIVSSIGSGAASGKLDLTKMISTLQGAIGDMNSDNADPQLANMMNMMNMFPFPGQK